MLQKLPNGSVHWAWNCPATRPKKNALNNGGAFRAINAPPQTLNVHKFPFIEVPPSCARSRNPALPHAGYVPQPAPPAAHDHRAPLGTSLRCPMNLPPSQSSMTQIRRTTFIPPQHTEPTACCGLFLPRPSQTFCLRIMRTTSLAEHRF